MARLLIKANVERKDPEESRLINGFSEVVKTINSNAISRGCFVAEYNKWCQKIQPNVTFLSGGYQMFLERTSPSALQRFFISTFAAVCFLESIRIKNTDCCFIGVFFCSLLALMSFITAIIGLLSTTPNKSVNSILNWISAINLITKEISHRLNRAGRVFQIIADPDMLHTISGNTDCLTLSRWKYFFRLFFLNFLCWFSIYGTAFAVQVCVILKVLSIMELTETLNTFSLIIIFVNALLQDLKIRRMKKLIRFQACCLGSETEKFICWFHDSSNLGLLLKQYEFCKEPVLNILKHENNIQKNTLSHSFILFAITVIKVSDGLQDNINSENLQTILRFLLFNDPNMLSKTKVKIISSKKPDIPSVLQTTKDLADCFLQLESVLQESKLVSSIPDKTTEGNKSGAIVQKILNPNEHQPADKESSKRFLKKSRNASKIPKKVPGVITRHSIGNEKVRFNEFSDIDTTDRHEKDNVKSENILKTTLKVTKREDFGSDKNKPSTSFDVLPSFLQATTEKPEEIDLVPESEVNDGDACKINSYIKENEKSKNFQKAALKVTEGNGSSSEENKLSISLDDIPSAPQSNLSKDMVLHSTLDQEALYNENEQTNLLNDMALQVSIDQEIADNYVKNVISSIPKNTVLHSRLTQEVLGEGINKETTIPPDDTVLYFPPFQEDEQKNGNKNISTSVEKDLSEANRNVYISLRNDEHDDRENDRNFRTRDTFDSRAISNVLEKEDSDGKTADNEMVAENISRLKKTESPLISSKSPNSLTLLSLLIKQTYDNKDSNFAQYSGKDENMGIKENSETTKGSTLMNKSDTPERTKAVSNKRDFMPMNPDLNQDTVIAEADETSISKLKNLDETFRNTENESSSVVKAHSNVEVKNPEEIHIQEIKLQADDFKAITQESECDKNLKSIHLNKTFINQRNSLSYIRFEEKNSNHHQNVYQQSVQDNEQNLENAVFKEKIRETVRNFFEHRSLPNCPGQIPANEATKQNHLFYINFKDTKDNSKETRLHQDTIVQSHPINVSLTNENKDYFKQAGSSAELEDNTDFEIFKRPYFNKKQFKIKEKVILKSNYKQRKRKTHSRNDSESEDPPADIYGLGNIIESNVNILNSMMRSLSIDSQNQEPSNNQNGLIEDNKKNAHHEIDFSKEKEKTSSTHNRSNASVFGSPQFLQKDSEIPSNNNLVKSPFGSYTTAKEAHSETDFRKEKEKNSNNRFNFSVFGPPQFPLKDSKITTNNSLLRSHFGSYTVAKEAHSEIDFNKENGKNSNNTCNASVFGSPQFPLKDSKITTNNSLLRSPFGSNTTAKEAHSDIDFNKEKEKNSNNTCIASVFGSPQFPLKDSEITTNNSMLKSPFGSYTTAKEAHSEIDFNKEKEKNSNNTCIASVFGSPQFPLKDSEITTNNSMLKSPFGSYTTAKEAHSKIDFNKEKEKNSNNTFNSSVFGPPQLPLKDSEITTNNYLLRSRFGSYTTAKEAHSETDCNKEKENISDNRSKVFVFGSLHYPLKNSENTSTNNLESPFGSYASEIKPHSETDFNKELENNSNNRSNVFVFGSSQCPVKHSEKPSNNKLERDPLESYANTNAAHQKTLLHESPTEGFEKSSVKQNSKENQKASNIKSEVFEFGSTKSSTKDSAKEKLSSNSSQRNLFESFANENGDPAGFGFQGFSKGSLKKQGVEQNIDSSASNEILVNENSSGLVQRNSKTGVLKKSIKDKETRSRLRIKTYYQNKTALAEEESNSSSGKMVSDPQKITSVTLTAPEEEIENQVERNMRKAIQKRTFKDFVSESIVPSNQLNINPTFDPVHKEDKISTGKENESFDSEQEPSNQEETRSSNDKGNKTCNDRKGEIFNGEANGRYNSQRNGPSNGQANEYFSIKETASPDGNQNKSFSAEENGPINHQGNQTSSNKENRPCSSEENEPCSEIENASPDGNNNGQNKSFNAGENGPINHQGNQTSSNKENRPCSSEENEPCSEIENASPNGNQNKSFNAEENGPINDQGNQTSSNKENRPCSSEENEPCSEKENASPDGNQNKSFNAGENGPINDQGNQISNNKENRPCSSEENEPYSEIENASPNGNQNKSFNAEENGPINDQGNQTSSNKENRPCSSEENEPYSEIENASPNGNQNKSFNAEENGPINDQGNQTSSNKENRPCSSEENEPCSEIENACPDCNQNKSFNSEENGPINDQGNQISNKEYRPCSSEENEPCSEIQNTFPEANQNKFFNVEENGPINDQGNQTCTNIENKTFIFQENGPNSGTKNASTDGKQNKTVNDEENVSFSGQYKQTSINKESEHYNTEANQSYNAGENESNDSEEIKFHSLESIVRSSVEKESFSDKENEFCDAQEYRPWNDKEQSLAAKCFLIEEKIELKKTEGSEAMLVETETLVNSTNDSASLNVPTRADLEKISEKDPRSFESSATSELKTFTLSESEVLLKKEEAAKDGMASQQSQDLQTQHAEISDASRDADNLNRSDTQSKKYVGGADNLTDSGFFDIDRNIPSLQQFSQNLESNTCQSNEDELGKESSANKFEENSHLFARDENGTSTHLDHSLSEENSSESPSSENKEYNNFNTEGNVELPEDSSMNLTQIDVNKELNQRSSTDENQHHIIHSSNSEEVSGKHSGTASDRAEYSSESKSPKCGIATKGSGKRFRKKNKMKERRSSGVKEDTSDSDSDSRQNIRWDSNICSRLAQERVVQKTARKVSTSECDEKECHIECSSNKEVDANQHSGTTSKGAECSSSSDSVIVRVNTSENGAAVSEQNQMLVPDQSECFYTRDQDPVCSLRYKDLDVDIFLPLSRLKLNLECRNGKTQINSENNETRINESSVSQSINSNDSLTSEFQSDDSSAEQNVTHATVSQSSGVIKQHENKRLHFEDMNVSLNYSKPRASLNYSHSSSEGNQITFKSKNTELIIQTENIDESELNIS